MIKIIPSVLKLYVNIHEKLKHTYGIEKENSLLLKLGQKIIINALEEKTNKKCTNITIKTASS